LLIVSIYTSIYLYRYTYRGTHHEHGALQAWVSALRLLLADFYLSIDPSIYPSIHLSIFIDMYKGAQNEQQGFLAGFDRSIHLAIYIYIHIGALTTSTARLKHESTLFASFLRISIYLSIHLSIYLCRFAYRGTHYEQKGFHADFDLSIHLPIFIDIHIKHAPPARRA